MSESVKSKMFGGKGYRYGTKRATKGEAELLAKKYRKVGVPFAPRQPRVLASTGPLLARVTREKSPSGAVYYAVWIRGR